MYLMPSKHHLEKYDKENKTKQKTPKMPLGLKYNSRQPSQGQAHHPAEKPQPGGFWESEPVGAGRSMMVTHVSWCHQEKGWSGFRTENTKPQVMWLSDQQKPSPGHLQVRLALPSSPSSWHCWHDHSKHSKMV